MCGYYDILSCVQLKQTECVQLKKTEAPSVDDIQTRIVDCKPINHTYVGSSSALNQTSELLQRSQDVAKFCQYGKELWKMVLNLCFIVQQLTYIDHTCN